MLTILNLWNGKAAGKVTMSRMHGENIPEVWVAEAAGWGC